MGIMSVGRSGETSNNSVMTVSTMFSDKTKEVMRMAVCLSISISISISIGSSSKEVLLELNDLLKERIKEGLLGF